MYRVRKFVRRHRVGVGAAIAVSVALLAGVVGTTLMAIRAVRAERAAQRTAAFLIDLFQVADPEGGQGNTVTAREILDKGVERVRQELGDEPLVKARLLNTLGNVYRGLGLYPSSRDLLLEALAIRKGELGPTHPDVAATLNDLAFTRHRLGEVAEGVREAREALAISARRLGHDHLQAGWSLYHLAANLMTRSDDRAESHSLFRRALDVFQSRQGPNALPVAWCLTGIGINHVSKEQYREALAPLRGALRIKEALLGRDHPDVAIGYSNLAYTEALTGDYVHAERAAMQAVAIGRRVLGAEHPYTAMFLHTQADVLRREGKFREAEPLLSMAIAIQEAKQPRGMELPLSLWTLAAVHAAEARFQQAEVGFRRSIALYEATDPKARDHVACLEEFARMCDRLHRTDEARELRRRAASIRAETGMR
jgi:tetratricopeptide (TPR) repeat protein